MGNAQVSLSVSHSIGKCSEIHQIERAWEIDTHTFPKVSVFFSMRFPSYGISYHMENAWLFPLISHSINSRHAGTKSKIYQKKKRAWMLFHQKRGIQIYIRQKYTTLHKTFLTFNNQLQKLQLLPKNFNEKRSNRGIWQESVRGL